MMQKFLVLFVFFFSCSEERPSISNNPPGNISELYDLVEVSEKKFCLDSLTAYYTPCIQYFEDENFRFLTFLNPEDNSIYYYDYESTEYIKKIKFGKAGYLGSGPISNYYISEDSIFLLHRNSRTMTIVDSSGKFIDNFKVNSNSITFSFDGFVGDTFNPITRVDNFIYLNSYFGPIGFTPQKKYSKNLTLRVNLLNKSLSEMFSFPDIYTQGLWEGKMTTNYYDYNPRKKIFVHSFPISHDLYITDHKGMNKKYYAGSKYFNEIKSIEKRMIDTREGRVNYFATTPSYSVIIYDEYRKFYYRIALQAISADDIALNDPDKSNIKHASIIILDENLNKIGETLLPRFDYTELMFFVTEEGLHLGKWSKSRNDENNLYFGIFKPIRNIL